MLKNTVIYYNCPECETQWLDIWDCEVDGDCPNPNCGLENISPIKSISSKDVIEWICQTEKNKGK